jgi:hypothetical protein
MGLKISLRRRAMPNENLKEITSHVVQTLVNLGVCFKADGYHYELGSGGSGAADISDVCVSGVTASLSFSSRIEGDLVDAAIADDILTVEVTSSQFSFCVLSDWLRVLAVQFGAYRGALITDEDVNLDDFEAVIDLSEETGRDEDGRDSIYRFWPSMVIDEELASRCFRLTIFELNARLEKIAAASSLDGELLWIRFSDEFLFGATLDGLNQQVRSLLS